MNPPLNPAGEGRLAAGCSLLLLTLFSFSVTLVPIRADNDCWWHVKTGKYIAEHGIPEHDVFSYTAGDHVWDNHEWLTQLGMWKIWSAGERTFLGGWRAVILAKGVVLWLCYAVIWYLAGRISRNWWIALLVAVIALAIGRRTFYPRPPVVSNLLLALTLLLYTGVHEKWWSRWWLASLVPGFAIWSNLHGAWMAGLVVTAAYFGQDVFSWLRSRAAHPFEDPPAPVPLRWWGVLFPAVLLATLMNPFGLGLYSLPARVLSDPDLVARISELQQPQLRYTWVFEYSVLGILALACLTQRFRARFAELAIFLFFLHQGLHHVRHLLLFGVMMTPLAARVFAAAASGLPAWFGGLLGEEASLARQRAGALLLGAGILLTALVLRNPPEPLNYPLRNRQFLALREGYLRWEFPAAVCDFIETAGLEGRMFNENHYGGYVLWRLSPEKYKVFSDPRFDIFGGEILEMEDQVVSGESLAPLDEYNVQWAIARTGTGLAWHLSQSGDWTKVADWSEISAQPWQIWIRATDGNEQIIRRSRRIFESQYGPLSP